MLKCQFILCLFRLNSSPNILWSLHCWNVFFFFFLILWLVFNVFIWVNPNRHLGLFEPHNFSFSHQSCKNCAKAKVECNFPEDASGEHLLREWVSLAIPDRDYDGKFWPYLQPPGAETYLNAFFSRHIAVLESRINDLTAALRAVTSTHPPFLRDLTTSVEHDQVDKLSLCWISQVNAIAHSFFVVVVKVGSMQPARDQKDDDVNEDDLVNGIGFLSLTSGAEPLYVGGSSGASWGRIFSSSWVILLLRSDRRLSVVSVPINRHTRLTTRLNWNRISTGSYDALRQDLNRAVKVLSRHSLCLCHHHQSSERSSSHDVLPLLWRLLLHQLQPHLLPRFEFRFISDPNLYFPCYRHLTQSLKRSLRRSMKLSNLVIASWIFQLWKFGMNNARYSLGHRNFKVMVSVRQLSSYGWHML